MTGTINMSGLKYGSLTAVEEVGRNRRNQAMWLCICDCGNTPTVIGSSLRHGNTKSCGCLRNRASAERRTTHGASKNGKEEGAYVVWKGMRQRCLNPKNPSWAHYGGRGVKICQRWLDSYAAFLEDMGERPDGLTIERKDTNGDYTPDNCVWATRQRQSRNTRQTLRIILCGQITPLVDACERFGLNHASVKVRMYREGQSATEAFYFLLDRKQTREGLMP